MIEIATGINNDFHNEMIKKYGDLQLVVTFEEFSELQKEICKYMRSPSMEVKKHITEEIGDVLIMLEQLIVHLDISTDDIANDMKFKINRTKERLLK